MFKFSRIVVFALTACAFSFGIAAQEEDGLKGDPKAIHDAKKMVEKMGGLEVWGALESVHFVHEWDIVNRREAYLENEILDLSAPRSYVTMESESYTRIRAYSPEHRYWNIVNGEFSYASDESFERAIARAPYSIFRLARAIGRNDPTLTIEFGNPESIPRGNVIQFTFDGDEPGGWILLNPRFEPFVWATTQYEYAFGPLARFGNLWVPNWANSNNGLVRYEMVSLKGSNKAPDMTLFVPPAG
ncbi:MAG: hypothetical protein JJ850_18300 [Kordiimonadaceae bacterium]|nr:hypothetical protein [Kordiimonadaceae bacterium]MBO6570565.1 hypothetical protein [Kordiimonadaceae bacterium]MBO6966577.1 hypothetical protein [Kordiimonadaceae bacterium]